MKKLLLITLSLIFPMAAFADELNLAPLLNRVSFQLKAETWVSSKTALVNVAINAAVTDQGIEKIQADVMQKLNQLSNKGEWHILSYQRQQDKSGLENVQMMAQARLAQTDMADLRTKAKSLSKPGATFSIDSIAFTPSEEEIRLAANNLRTNIYQQAKAEIEGLNKIYPDQKYYLYQLDVFTEPTPPINAMALPRLMATSAAPAEMPPAPAALNVGNRVQITASVTAAAIPDQILQKLGR